MKTLVFSLGLLLAVEGLLYAAAPDFMKRMAALLIELSTEAIRQNGILAASLGAVLIYIAARFLQ